MKMLLRYSAIAALIVLFLAVGFWSHRHFFSTGVIVSKPERIGNEWFVQATHEESPVIDRKGFVLGQLPPGEGLFGMDGAYYTVHEEHLRKTKHKRTFLLNPNRCFHHDIQVDLQGNVLVPCRTLRRDTQYHATLPIMNDLLLRIDPESGKELFRWSALDHLESLKAKGLRPDMENIQRKKWTNGEEHLDWSHLNGISVVPENDWQLPHFKKGNILLSFGRAFGVALISPETGEVLWAWSHPHLRLIHSPSFTDRGTLLLFNNFRNGTEVKSDILEVDLATEKIVGSFRPKNWFFRTASGGTVRELPNGNLVSTISQKGEIVEFTRSGDIVWAYRSPRFAQLKLATRLYLHFFGRQPPFKDPAYEGIFSQNSLVVTDRHHVLASLKTQSQNS